jgi:hypothetical protein
MRETVFSRVITKYSTNSRRPAGRCLTGEAAPFHDLISTSSSLGWSNPRTVVQFTECVVQVGHVGRVTDSGQVHH